MTSPTQSTPAAPTLSELIGIWQAELTAIADLCEPLDAEQWTAQTPCPGWTVADIVAHLIDVEQFLGGHDRPIHEPDWAALPHATGNVGRLTEIGVDVRRGRPQPDLIAELRAVIPMRRAQLDETEPGAQVTGPFGKAMPIEQLVRMRTFDAWVHEEDIRSAIGVDGGWNSDAAGIAFLQIVGALPFVWARGAGAPVGSTLCVTVVGPDLHHEVSIAIDDSGKGVRIPSRPDADVQLDIMWAALMQLACGRLAPGDPSLAARLELRGDPALGQALLRGMTITP
jgi:uncharacterized protein (TIGR03083 family)